MRIHLGFVWASKFTQPQPLYSVLRYAVVSYTTVQVFYNIRSSAYVELVVTLWTRECGTDIVCNSDCSLSQDSGFHYYVCMGSDIPIVATVVHPLKALVTSIID